MYWTTEMIEKNEQRIKNSAWKAASEFFQGADISTTKKLIEVEQSKQKLADIIAKHFGVIYI